MERVRQKGITGDAESFLAYVALNEVVEHRMDRQKDIRALRFYESADIPADFRIKEMALVRPRSIDQPEVPAHPLGAVRKQGIVEIGEGSIDPRRFF